MEKVVAVFGLFVISLALVLGLAMLMAYPTMWVMNYLFTAQLLAFVFGAAKITFWQAFFLNMITGVFFRSGGSSSSSKD